LTERGKTDLADKVRRSSELLSVETAIQDKALGLGHAVGCAEGNLTDADDAVAVLLPDDLVLPSGVLARMAQVRAEFGGSVLCASLCIPVADTTSAIPADSSEPMLTLP